MAFRQIRAEWLPAEPGSAPSAGGVGEVVYLVNEVWTVTITREFGFPVDGPTRLLVEGVPPGLDGDEVDFGAFDGAGLQVADLRAIPLVEARGELQRLWMEHRAGEVMASLPADFTGDYALAMLAKAFVTLHGWGVRNVVGEIAKAREPKVLGTWAARVRRARAKGFLTASDAEPALTGKALALLEA